MNQVVEARDARVAVYVRVSTDIQASKEEGSLETQEARLRAHFISRGVEPGSIVVYREEGKSGKSLDRPEVQRLLTDVRAGRVQTVAVTRFDRISRSLRDFLDLTAEFDELDVKIISLKEQFDTSTPIGRASLKILLVFAELERETTSERTRDSIRARAQRGLWNGGPPPLGLSSDGHGHLMVVPEEAALVIIIYEKFVELGSTVKLEKWLNEQGYRQKVYESRRRGKRGGKPFSKATLLRLLRNPAFVGRVIHRGTTYEGQHDAIIKEELFHEAQEILDRNGANQRKTKPKRGLDDYLLTGRLRCACGSSLTTSRGKGYRYYRCSKDNREAAHKRPVKTVRAERVEEAVLNVIRRASREREIIDEAVAEGNELLQQEVSPIRLRLQQMKKDLRRVDADGEALYQRVKRDELDDLPWARRELRELAERQRQLEAAVERTGQEVEVQESMELDAAVLSEAVQGVDSAWDDLTAPERKDLLRLLVREVRVADDKKEVEVDLYQGIAVVAGLSSGRVTNASPGKVNHPGHTVCDRDRLAPEERLELPTRRLTAACSTD